MDRVTDVGCSDFQGITEPLAVVTVPERRRRWNVCKSNLSSWEKI